MNAVIVLHPMMLGSDVLPFERQHDECVRYCRENGYRIVSEYYAKFYDFTPVAKEIRKAIESGDQVDVILVPIDPSMDINNSLVDELRRELPWDSITIIDFYIGLFDP